MKLLHRKQKWFDSDPRMHRHEHVGEALRREAAQQFRAEVTDKYLYVAQVKPLEVAHRGNGSHTLCGRQLGLFEQIAAARAIEFVMQPCVACPWEEHTDG